MKNESFEITAIRFFEHPVVDISQAEPSHYDVTAIGLKYPLSFIADNGFLMNAYCEAVLLKIIGLDKTEIAGFLDYQCGMVKEPTAWLNQFEILIDQNLCYFDDPIQQLKVNKLYINIQFCKANPANKHKPLNNLHVNWDEILAPEHSVKFDFC